MCPIKGRALGAKVNGTRPCLTFVYARGDNSWAPLQKTIALWVFAAAAAACLPCAAWQQSDIYFFADYTATLPSPPPPPSSTSFSSLLLSQKRRRSSSSLKKKRAWKKPVPHISCAIVCNTVENNKVSNYKVFTACTVLEKTKQMSAKPDDITQNS